MRVPDPVPANWTPISEYEPPVLDEIILPEPRAWGGRSENKNNNLHCACRNIDCTGSVYINSCKRAGKNGQQERPVLEFEGFTRTVVSGANTKSELGAYGITEPGELTIPISVKRFDLVTFNPTELCNQIRNGSVSLHIRGNSYDAELKRMELDIRSVGNGI